MAKIQNKKLEESLKSFTKKACEFFNEIIPPTGAYEDIQIWSIISQNQDLLKTLKEYPEALNAINSDKTVQKLTGKLVGTLMLKINIGTSEDQVIFFATTHYLNNKSFDEEEFEKQYLAFEDLFYTDKISFIDYARLHYFETEIDEVILETGLKMKKSPREINDQEKITEMKYNPLTPFSISEFILERKYSRKKRTQGDEDKQIEPGDPKYATEFNLEANETNEIFDQVIKALRILKSSAVFREYKVATQNLTYLPHSGIMTRFPLVSDVLSGDKCVINEAESKELIEIFKKVKSEESNRFKIASDRLSFGITRRTKEDRLIDYMIGLESLYLPEIYDELSFRLAVRISFMLEENNSERKSVFLFIKKMYLSRSKIVHGEAYELTDEDVKRIEEILRKSIKIWLKEPKVFDKNKFDDKLFGDEK